MIVTEHEAKQKWCPFARVMKAEHETVVVNRGDRSSDWPNCVGRRCMAWRWADAEPSDIKEGLRVGCCGLVGDPKAWR